MDNKLIIEEGTRYGRYTILHEVKEGNPKERLFMCRCDCGKEKIVRLRHLRSGAVVSCGCKVREDLIRKNYKHGGCFRQDRVEKLYGVWISMKQRCTNPKNAAYSYYGGRGITVCDEWLHDYTRFKQWALEHGYKEGLTIDRIDDNGNYEPSNCRWATYIEQANNTRKNLNITYKDETHTLAEWGRILGIKYNTLMFRYRKGLPLEQVFFVGSLR